MSVKDLTGQKFGRLKVICRAENKSGHTNWHCLCDCGNEKDVLGINLTRGLTKSCGCYHNKDFGERRLIDLTGKKFGKLTVIERAENRGNETFWKCKCDCGNTKKINGSKLKNGHTKSCGCYKKEISHAYKGNNSLINKTHGMSESRLYRIYKKMYRRCYKPQTKYYCNYGGRGIKICQEWLDDFMNFYKWAMENGYSDELSIDRIDNNGNYEPNNCRWATRKEQANNTRKTVFLTYKGETKSASEWSKITGIRQDTITMRKRKGLTDEECLIVK